MKDMTIFLSVITLFEPVGILVLLGYRQIVTLRAAILHTIFPEGLHRLRMPRHNTGLVLLMAAFITFPDRATAINVTLFDGTFKQIQNIQAGDMVLSYNEENGQVEGNQVTKLFVSEHKPGKLILITISGETIEVTPDYLLYVKNKGWIKAQRLNAGDQLVDAKQKAVNIDRIETKVTDYTDHTFEVAKAHTYFLGNMRILVHNPTGIDNEKEVVERGTIISGIGPSRVILTTSGKDNFDVRYCFKNGFRYNPNGSVTAVFIRNNRDIGDASVAGATKANARYPINDTKIIKCQLAWYNRKLYSEGKPRRIIKPDMITAMLFLNPPLIVKKITLPELLRDYPYVDQRAKALGWEIESFNKLDINWKFILNSSSRAVADKPYGNYWAKVRGAFWGGEFTQHIVPRGFINSYLWGVRNTDNLAFHTSRARELGVVIMDLGIPRFSDIAAGELDGVYKWVVRQDGILVLGKIVTGQEGALKHSVLAGGRSVIAAGSARINNGEGAVLTSYSGHYKDLPLNRVYIAESIFRQHGINFSETVMELAQAAYTQLGAQAYYTLPLTPAHIEEK